MINGNTEDTRKLKHGTLILLFSTVLVKIISALFKIPLSSNYCLGDLGFGYFSSANDIFTPIYFVAVSGFPVAVSNIVSNFIATNNTSGALKTLKTSKKAILLFSAVFFIIYVICIFPFADFTDKTGNSIYSFLAVSPTIIFCLWSACYRGYYEGIMDMRPAAVSNIIEALGKLVLGLGLALAVMRLNGNPAYAAAAAMLGISLGTAASAMYLSIKYKTDRRKLYVISDTSATSAGLTSEKEIVKKLVLISVPVVAASLSGSVVALIDGLTVRYQLSDLLTANYGMLKSYYSELISEYQMQTGSVLSDAALPTVLYGIRSKAYTLFNLVPTLTAAIGVGLIPAITQSYVKKDKPAVQSNIGAAFKLSALVSFPAGIGYIVLGQRIMFLLYGSSVSSEIGGKMLSCYGIAAVFAGFSFPLASILQSVSKQRTALFNVFCGILVKVMLNIILCRIPEINICGSVYSTIACFAVICLLHGFCVVKLTGKETKLFQNIFKPLISAAVCAAAAYILCLVSEARAVTFISVILAAAVYFISMFLLKGFDETDILALPMGEKVLSACKKIKIIR